MSEELSGFIRPKITPYKKKPYLEVRNLLRKPEIDIAAISAIGMHYNLKV
jgi:hypothetical protein